MTRRILFETGAGAIFSSLLASSLAAADGPPGVASRIFSQELPNVSMEGWMATAVEVKYEPGGVSAPHRHSGFVIGYVLEGEVRFQLRGKPETTYRVGDMFYEAPGSVHQVSSNASATKPARILAIVFAEKTSPITIPA
jgi:quercetin dioxygenase-like cupin family protein